MATRSENAFHLGFDPRKQRDRLADDMSIRQLPPTPCLRDQRILRLNPIGPFQLANAIDETLHRLRRVYERIPVELAMC